MADLKALLAAKRAAQNPPEQKQEVAATPVNPTVSQPAPPKTLTFAEKLALKRSGSTSQVAAPAGNADSPTAVSSTVPAGPSPNAGAPTQSSQMVGAQESTGPAAKDAAIALSTAPTEVTGDSNLFGLEGAMKRHDAEVTARKLKMEEAILTDSVDPVIAQAYADISAKINLLESLEDTALEGAMKELKKALMANPDAVSLMLDTDYYKMVMALRKITREAAIEAAVEKKSGRTKAVKTAPLSAEQIASVFEEL